MSKYVLLYHGGSMPETEEEGAAVMKAWEVWYSKLGAAVVDAGNPFSPMAKSVSSAGKISDGAANGMASGYTILEAGSLDEAARMAQGCPVLAGGAQISIFETFEVM